MGYHLCDTLLDYCDPDTSKVGSMLWAFLTKAQSKNDITFMLRV